MGKAFKLFIAFLMLAGVAAAIPRAFAEAREPRLALVIGNANYRSGQFATPVNDAGLVAETLQAAGFDVTGAANLDQDALRRAFRDFLGKAQQVGTGGVVFVYLAGRALQYSGENYFVPVEAVIKRDADVPLQAVRLSDFTQALAALPLKARIVVIDGARANSFARTGAPLAGGLALIEAEPRTLYAFNAAPGTIAPDEPGPYGIYAQALVEMMREGGLPADEVFARVRLRVDELTRGAVVPWDVSKLDAPIVFFAPAANTLPAAQAYADLLARPIRDFPPAEAYAAAVERDTLAAYQEFLIAFPGDPLAVRVRALLAARREALTWRRAVEANTPNAYWTYMRRYPRGPPYMDARRRLVLLSAPLEPPPRFDVYDFEGLPPPQQDEYVIIDQPVVVFHHFDYPPVPAYFLPPRPVEYRELPPPPPPPALGFLPVPVPLALPHGRPLAEPGHFTQGNYGQEKPQAPVREPSSGAAEYETPKLGTPGHGLPSPPPPVAGAPAAPEHALPAGEKLPRHLETGVPPEPLNEPLGAARHEYEHEMPAGEPGGPHHLPATSPPAPLPHTPAPGEAGRPVSDGERAPGHPPHPGPGVEVQKPQPVPMETAVPRVLPHQEPRNQPGPLPAHPKLPPQASEQELRGASKMPAGRPGEKEAPHHPGEH